MGKVKIFNYLPELDAFIVTDEYRKIADTLDLSEWNPVVWIGRLFTLDNDFGEHWFDNWELREERKEQADAMGIPYEELLIIDPERFRYGDDGPCNHPQVRKAFWTEVLDELRLSHDLLFDKARDLNEKTKRVAPDEYITDLENRIQAIRQEIK
jgi:hypothetical protein